MTNDHFAFRQIVNIKNGDPYWLASAKHVRATDEVVADIVACCNEPLIYDRCFKAQLNGFRFRPNNALVFLRWAQEHEVYLIFSARGHVVGAIHIARGEVGFWCSKDHAGCITPALGALVALPRTGKLFANVHKDNGRSVAALKANGFASDDGVYFVRKFCVTH